MTDFEREQIMEVVELGIKQMKVLENEARRIAEGIERLKIELAAANCIAVVHAPVMLPYLRRIQDVLEGKV